jgi:hypothetical protein
MPISSYLQLINVNQPDLVLFVGEALVGNEAVDQLVKFNQAMADQATPGAQARLIDGIVLTKFDTIDDKVERWLRTLLYFTRTGWRRNINDVYYWTTDCVCRYRTDVQ